MNVSCYFNKKVTIYLTPEVRYIVKMGVWSTSTSLGRRGTGTGGTIGEEGTTGRGS